ncbi:DNA cytosine methyltransferase [Streptomyces corynorhini]|uniref:Cytosine-specific methyltransferase n=1 Tax=Streptomyces corynorhini TaxID=2282652 RepID=A0A370BAB6_9ACTN|nr:DNA cytosine methyltransferase [Streptomyces corynorhini]RDG36385.1 DNA cytosine methyltransferase [Streptomyces corynorhini]
MTSTEREFTSVEICAGAGGQAYGLHEAKFRHLALIEIDKHACETLKLNVEDNAEWEGCEVIEADLLQLDPHKFRLQLGLEQGDLDLLAGGVPCPPFSIAGKQLGEDDERDLFPTMLNMVEELRPKAVMIENVRGLLDQKFQDYREKILKSLESMGYAQCYWKVLEAKDYGVPQLRPRAILVAMKKEYAQHFLWSEPEKRPLVTVGEALAPTMKERFDAIEDPRAEAAYGDWFESASKGVAPTLVGGSKKHGGADLGPTRAKKAWKELGVCGLGVANKPQEMVDSERDLFAAAGPKLTVQQAAIIQGFPRDWKFPGRKTASYRQVGNAFPPPVAKAVGEQIYTALKAEKSASTTKRDRLTSSLAPAAASASAADRRSDLERAGVR